MREEVSVPASGSQNDKSTFANLLSKAGNLFGSNAKTGGRSVAEREALREFIKEYFGKAPGTTAMSHAEADALIEAWEKGLIGKAGVMVVDRLMCNFCQTSLKNLLPLLGMESLTVYAKQGEEFFKSVIYAP